MKVMFMGTPAFALPSLEMLLKEHTVCAVVTQPDRPKGRGKKRTPSPVKELAQKHGIPVLQPERVREEGFLAELREYSPEIIVVVAFGQILPETVLNYPPCGCVNVHGSLLPKYRGAAPIQWAVLNGDQKTGVTTMYMAKGMDTGDMLKTAEMEIFPEDTYGSLRDRMAELGAETLKETLKDIEAGVIKRTPQKDEEATMAPMITKEMEKIDWTKSGRQILCQIKGLSPEPGAYAILEDEPIKIWKAALSACACENGTSGEIVSVTKKVFCVKTGDGALEILEVQARGGKKMDAGAYMRGHEIKEGQNFL